LKKVLPFLILSLVMAGLISLFASSNPDGLEWAAKKLGFIHKAVDKSLISSPMPDYTFPLFGKGKLSTAIAGIVGTLICFFLPFTLYLLKKK